jgi:hypothetical protein
MEFAEVSYLCSVNIIQITTSTNKMSWGSRSTAPSFLTTTTDGEDWSASPLWTLLKEKNILPY